MTILHHFQHIISYFSYLFWKSIKKWQSYGHEFGVSLFLEHGVVLLSIKQHTKFEIPIFTNSKDMLVKWPWWRPVQE